MRGPIRLLHVITSLNQGGAEAMLVKLCGAMDRSRFDIRVAVLLDDGVLQPEIEQLGIPVTSLGMTNGRPSLSALVKLRALIKEFRPDITQSWLYHADLMATVAGFAAPAGVQAWNLRCSAMDFSNYSRVTQLVVRMLARLSRRPAMILSNAQTAITLHQQMGYRPQATTVIPNGFDTERFQPNQDARAALRSEWGVEDATLLIGLPARFDAQKDHGTFFAACAELASKRQITALVAGDGTDGPALAAIAAAAPELPVIRLGPRRDLERVYPALDLVMMSSAYGEAFPNVLGEALASGVPAVATDVGAAREILEGLTGVAPVRDAPALAALAAEVLDLPQTEYESLQARARARVQERYSLGAVAGAYETLYTKLAEQRT